MGPIGDRRRPGCREDAFILDSQMELQKFAPMIAIEDRTPAGEEIFFQVPCDRACGLVVINDELLPAAPRSCRQGTAHWPSKVQSGRGVRQMRPWYESEIRSP